jgi:hypothetical protein
VFYVKTKDCAWRGVEERLVQRSEGRKEGKREARREGRRKGQRDGGRRGSRSLPYVPLAPRTLDTVG